MHQTGSPVSGFDPLLLSRLRYGQGMFAALDQSGGSTPAALTRYGVDASQYKNEEEMFEQIHEMRLRVIESPAFFGDRILAVILFTRTLKGSIQGRAIPQFLADKGGIASFLKIDAGLEQTGNGVQLMKTISDLPQTLTWAQRLGVVGTKMRSLIHATTEQRIIEAVTQQFALAEMIFATGLLPIVEIELSTALPERTRELQELQLHDAVLSALEKASDELRVFLKLTIPVVAGSYTPLMNHRKVYRVLALSGGFSRLHACKELAKNPGMIASFSRALLEDLHMQMAETDFDRILDLSIAEVIQATTDEVSSNEIGAKCCLATDL